MCRRGDARAGHIGRVIALLVLAYVLRPDTAAAQTCRTGTTNSCMSVSFSSAKPTPDGSDFAAGVSVLGSFAVAVIKCGRPPCELTMAAANQPSNGLRVRVGASAPTSIADCPIDLTGVNSAQSSRAPVIAVTSGPAAYTVWVCRPLSWNPATTPLGASSPEIRFRLRQG